MSDNSFDVFFNILINVTDDSRVVSLENFQKFIPILPEIC